MTEKFKLKPKSIIITILIITIIIATIINISMITNLFENKNSTKKQLDKKLKQLNNIEQKVKYFNYDNIDRYLKYKNNNKNLSEKQIIINVNIGLDQQPYQNTKETKHLHKNYILINKYHYLKETYIPKNLEEINKEYTTGNVLLTKEAKEAFEQMSKDAKKDNLSIIAFSGYRDYTYQKNLYNKYIEQDGKEKADTYSARPGYSEHQTGLTVDVYNGITDYNNFDNTDEYKWLQENAYKYGYILRYPQDKTDETLYQYEPWHYRYVGTKIATYIKKHNISFEEYYVTHIKS